MSAAPNDALRDRIELGIGLVAPFLDLLIAVGDRVSRIFASGEPDPLPARIRLDGERAARGLPARASRGD
jgi:hypothetical protein